MANATTDAAPLSKSQQGTKDAIELLTKLGFSHQYTASEGAVMVQETSNGDKPEVVAVGSYGRLSILTVR